ncbi:hypothetical protein F2P58_23395 [Vibrio fortis]|uniref:Uncharacterized protein n=1 Tax=Vibrio fortis TaxID=212667 RepID=A0A5N3QUX4_9VIBR|nr:hypothetical protein [Vibrio fortis]KAB0285461.1 hypothetical protein F2P58_23395 [Vibrio fortis]
MKAKTFRLKGDVVAVQADSHAPMRLLGVEPPEGLPAMDGYVVQFDTDEGKTPLWLPAGIFETHAVEVQGDPLGAPMGFEEMFKGI